ncbi:ATP-binding protein [Streptomyces gobiensis]|uniref:ATP-binding protein n=1 Tax=Streptomyces gobiensis TaxID=2875706 RepID=UPI001E4F83FD|nr:ATP-binding protein [Streptomyces gobiensis]UGY91241.1 ATP-binding protein [Streptomyces gobiensis]
MSVTPTPLRTHVSVTAALRRVRELRHVGAACVQQWHLSEVVDVDTVKLLISELVSNAIVHGHGDDAVSLVLSYSAINRELRIEVHEGGIPDGEHRPVLLEPADDDESGRGLLLVSQLAQKWGRTGTCTWCTLPVPCPAALAHQPGEGERCTAA